MLSSLARQQRSEGKDTNKHMKTQVCLGNEKVAKSAAVARRLRAVHDDVSDPPFKKSTISCVGTILLLALPSFARSHAHRFLRSSCSLPSNMSTTQSPMTGRNLKE